MALTRIYYVSDVHGSQRCFLKFVNAVRYKVYKADLAIMSGDLTGKALAPIVELSEGKYKRTVQGNEAIARNVQELADIEKRNNDVGLYSYIVEEDQLECFRRDQPRIMKVLSDLIVKRMMEWVQIADERLSGVDTKCFFLPGNDDSAEIDQAISKSKRITNPEGKVVQIDSTHEMISSGYSNPTPWNTLRELSEEKLLERIEQMAKNLKDPGKSVFNLHCPPFDSGLDTAPQLDANLRPVLGSGGLIVGPVGSKAVRTAIEKYQPLATFHGHIHESPGESRLGRTLSVNPGSEYNQGVLRGYIVDIEENKVKQYVRVEG